MSWLAGLWSRFWVYAAGIGGAIAAALLILSKAHQAGRDEQVETDKAASSAVLRKAEDAKAAVADMDDDAVLEQLRAKYSRPS